MAKKDEQQLNVRAGDVIGTIKDSVVAPDGTISTRLQVPDPPIETPDQERALGQHLTRLYYLQGHIVAEVSTKYMQSTDLVGIANLLTTFYEACQRERHTKIDFKAKGIAGYGHSLNHSEVESVARSLVMIFGPEFLLDTDKKKLFFDTLKSAVQDVADTITT